MGALIHVASSMPIRDLDSFALAREAPLFATASRGVNGIDGTLCTALGLAARHEGAAWALLGDLATLHDAGAFVPRRWCAPLRGCFGGGLSLTRRS